MNITGSDVRICKNGRECWRYVVALDIKVGPAAAPKFLEPRFKKEAWVTDTVLENRGRSFDLFDTKALKKLEQPFLVSSAHGRISKILMTLPWWVFLEKDEVSESEWISLKTTADSLQSVWRLLPNVTKFIIMVNEKAYYDEQFSYNPPERLRVWLQNNRIIDRTKIIVVPTEMSFTIWAEDAYAACVDLLDSETYLVEPASFRRGDDALIADTLENSGTLERSLAKLYFQGGNILIADNFWLIGMDYPNNSLKYGYIKPGYGESPIQAVARAYGIALDHKRRFLTIGSRLPVPTESQTEYLSNGKKWVEIKYAGNYAGTVQPLFHIDMFITLAGRDPSGHYIVMVGDPQLAANLLNEGIREHAMYRIFHDFANQLKNLGLHVVRTPLPLTYDDVSNPQDFPGFDMLRMWYFATSNNALVQINHDVKEVWLPTYGHRKWKELTVTDEANKQIWERHGFKVHQLGDFHPFAVNLGAAHCIKKYIARD